MYNLYNSKGEIIFKNLYTLKKYHKKTIDSVTITDNDTKYYTSFSEIIDTNSGILRCYGSKTVKTHSFILGDKIAQDTKLKLMPPFSNTTTKFLKMKKYNVNNKEYYIYNFYEYTGTLSGYSSYYLKEVGFICYYNSDIDRYILCDSASKNQNLITSINKILILDKSFFAKYFTNRPLPVFRKL